MASRKSTGALIAILLLCGAISGARIFGTVYDEDLQAARSAVQINTTPGQQLISTNGEYAFLVPPGSYRLSAVGDNSSAEKNVFIQEGDGEFRIDLILLPGVPPEDAVLADLLDVPEINDPNARQEPAAFPFLPLVAALGAVVLLAAAYVHRDRLPVIAKSRKTEAPSAPAPTPASTVVSRIFTADQNKVLQALSSFGNRASQKDLRKALHFWSEAKVSMELTELEELGAIEKIKKGRGNVIRRA